MSEETEEVWFEPSIIYTSDQPAGFKEWTKGITYNKYKIMLPDGTSMNAKMFLDLQQRFESDNYTTYLVNRYTDQ
jgi:hypothetical protein